MVGEEGNVCTTAVAEALGQFANPEVGVRQPLKAVTRELSKDSECDCNSDM